MQNRYISTLAAVFALICLGFSAPAMAQSGPRAEGNDMVIGAPDAPITMIEYASLTCPHCARFQAEVAPRLKSEYVDTGKLKFVFRDFPLDRMALNAQMLARCAGPERFFGFLDVFFAQQGNWTRGTPDQMMQNLRRLARLGGMTDAQMDTCLADQSVQNVILTNAMTGEREHKVQGTPTLVINGNVHRGEMSFEELDRVLKPLATKR